MRCMRCQERESVVQLHQIVNDQAVVVHLCQQCALEQGLEVEVGLESNPLSGFLAMLEKSPKDPAACPGCGATLEDYRATSRLGCPECYTAFARPLRDLLRRVHGSSRHTGQHPATPSADAEAPDRRAAAQQLREELEAAIAEERFERAAELRDLLRNLE